MSQVVVVGSYVQDLAFNTSVFPAPGESRIGTFLAGPGGKGFNQAVACNRLSIPTSFVGAVGNDIFAQGARDFAAQEGLTAELEVHPDYPTAAASIVIDGNAQNLIVVALGANNHLSEAHIRGAESTIAESSILVCQAESNLATTQLAMDIARTNDTLTILNPAPINEGLTLELLQLADVITPNETEFIFLMQHLFGVGIDEDFWKQDDSTLHELCRLARAPTVVLTLGEKGCFVSHDSGAMTRFESKQTHYSAKAIGVDAVDTTGAGDAFNGGLAAGLVKFQGDFAKAIGFANTVAGLSTSKAGTAPAMPYIKDVELAMSG